jgi:XTP/dITP diphosphohydrolase
MTNETVYIATSNAGKLRDFAAAARVNSIEVLPLPGFSELPGVDEDRATFAANARKKAKHYSKVLREHLVLADDSGLEVSALNGAPGVRSARFAAEDASEGGNASDSANNQKLLTLLGTSPRNDRAARFVATIAAAMNGKILATFTGEVEGTITHAPRGSHGFGYDPLFEVENTGKTMAELSAEEKAAISHRGRAFRRFLEWYREQGFGFAKL